MEKLKIEYQYFEGCPNHDKLHKNILDAVKGLEDKVEIEYILVDNNEIARKTGFRGSPTLLINGEDFEGMPPQTEPSLNCRFYKNGVPSAADIKIRLELFLKN
jgi:glutaredoxin